MTGELKDYLILLANKYETKEFLYGDPSWFMHQVNDSDNKEVMAFIASILSYGSRKQFLPKIQIILDTAGNDIYNWIKEGAFEDFIPKDENKCFYRLYNFAMMNNFFRIYRKLLKNNHSIGRFLYKNKINNGLDAIKFICSFFASEGISVIIPKDTTSACKRLCMFLRWMVRSNSPVDLGLWSDFIDRKTLIIPLDTHVLKQANNLQLIKSQVASMSSAQTLTKTLAEVFPNDPLKGDFALFGLGAIDNKKGT